MPNITLGSDVEVQIVNAAGDFISAVGLIGGSKEEPVWFDNFNLQEDNINVEFAINPVSTKEDWCEYLTAALSQVETTLSDIGYKVAINATAIYDDTQLATPEAKLFGCDPDFSAYTLRENIAPDPDDVGGLRSAGGHIHVGMEGVNIHELVKWMDVYLGLPALFMDEDNTRRQLYGQAGSHRAKPYGVEYRALSNFWIRDKELMEWAYDQTMKAIKAAQSASIEDIPDWTRIPRSINGYDRNMAEDVLTWLEKEGYNG